MEHSRKDLFPQGRPIFEGVSEGRRKNMQANRSKNTKPEMTVRRVLHALGYRYRLHSKDLPGRPDIVFRGRRKIIQIHGCFWHGHGCVPLGVLPKSRLEYWGPKISSTKMRDKRNYDSLVELGWSILTLWECDIRSSTYNLQDALSIFLENTTAR